MCQVGVGQEPMGGDFTRKGQEPSPNPGHDIQSYSIKPAHIANSFCRRPIKRKAPHEEKPGFSFNSVVAIQFIHSIHVPTPFWQVASNDPEPDRARPDPVVEPPLKRLR